MFNQSLGIDVASKDFQVCFKVRRPDGSIKIKGTRNFKNAPKGHKELVGWIEKKRLPDEPVTIAMEATGVYYESLAYHLHESGYPTHVLLPNRLKGYFKFLNLKSKTDKIEAGGLAELGLGHVLETWEPSSQQMYSLKGLNRERNTLVDHKTQVYNRLHAEEARHSPGKRTIKRLKQQLRLIEKQIKQVERDMEGHLDKDEQLKKKVDNICEVKGLGPITVLGIVAETNGFKLIRHRSQLVSYAGYDVVERQSGSSVLGKTRISKKGNRHIRRALHFPALTVVRYHSEFRNLYQRVYDRTKIKMKGYVAVQRKLLVLVYTLYKKNEAYDPTYAEKTAATQGGRQGTMPAYTG